MLPTTVGLLLLATLTTVISGTAALPQASQTEEASEGGGRNFPACQNGVELPGYAGCLCFCGWEGADCGKSEWRGLEECELPFAIPRPRRGCVRGYLRDEGSCHCACGWTGADCSSRNVSDTCEDALVQPPSQLEMKMQQPKAEALVAHSSPYPLADFPPFFIAGLMFGGVLLVVVLAVLVLHRSRRGHAHHHLIVEDKPLVDPTTTVTMWSDQQGV
ncbi:hypothetical protein PENTCL1PPCAC_20650 [Pristionchus entomophagus]|uniref:EGF-like domain-containing protein n=1 Tax=Pristionchus entomophagus TaxID=358040 RepID=A0AAV5TW46_9BILA|nr:hypothetical protein PENTCL1PPCAC_20650 [Pristionchus entomophagus]